jgi:hypothetical protein
MGFDSTEDGDVTANVGDEAEAGWPKREPTGTGGDAEAM